MNVAGWRALTGADLVTAVTAATWYAWPDDTIGGWCVMPYDGPPSTGVPAAAWFMGETLARHIAQLHNDALPTPPAEGTA
jgi:hypothetical protein